MRIQQNQPDCSRVSPAVRYAVSRSSQEPTGAAHRDMGNLIVVAESPDSGSPDLVRPGGALRMGARAESNRSGPDPRRSGISAHDAGARGPDAGRASGPTPGGSDMRAPRGMPGHDRCPLGRAASRERSPDGPTDGCEDRGKDTTLNFD